MNAPKYPYATFLDIRFPPLQLIDVPAVVSLGPWQGFTVPKGMVHRTRAPERAVILMMETAAIVPTGDARQNDRPNQ